MKDRLFAIENGWEEKKAQKSLKSCGKPYKKNQLTPPPTHLGKRFGVLKTKTKTCFCSDSKYLLQFPKTKIFFKPPLKFH